jgi:hypothetical protein
VSLETTLPACLSMETEAEATRELLWSPEQGGLGFEVLSSSYPRGAIPVSTQYSVGVAGQTWP